MPGTRTERKTACISLTANSFANTSRTVATIEVYREFQNRPIHGWISHSQYSLISVSKFLLCQHPDTQARPALGYRVVEFRLKETLFKIQRFGSEIPEQLGTSLNRGKLRRKHAGTRRGDMAPEPHARC